MGERLEYKIVWSETAIGDLNEISSFIAADNPQAAARLAREILAHVRILASFPLIGPTYPRGAPGPLREIVYRSYRIFYDVFEDAHRVDILHVWHGAREEPEF